MHTTVRCRRSEIARWSILGLLALAVLWVGCSAAQAAETPGGKRSALVIGNARYPQMALTNPENDARVIAATLRRLGFEVTEHVNLGVKRFRQVLRDYARQIESEKGVSVFYYAGHGVQIEGRNYLLPVDVNLRDEYEIRDEGVDIDELFIGRLERARSQTRIVILDACRDNPFTTRTRAVRGAGGLAEMAARGALIAYATAPGSVAEDGPPGTNSVFTRHLAKELLSEGIEVEQMFKNVRVKVMRDTEQRQVPWVNTSMTSNFSFNPTLANGREEEARRADLARLQALLEQREQQQKALETQLEQMARRLAESREQAAQRAGAAAASAESRPAPAAAPTLRPPAATATARPTETLPTATPTPTANASTLATRPNEPSASVALDVSAPGGMSQAAYEAAKAWMAARAKTKAPPPAAPSPMPERVQSAAGPLQQQRPMHNETISPPPERVALSPLAPRAGPSRGGS